MSGSNGSRPAPAEPDHEVAVIGAGLSGIGMGAALNRAGIEDFVIFERADDVGGTWRANTYPGIGVDIPVFSYQFSYDLKPDWSRFFPSGGEVKRYVDDYVEKYAIRPHIRFNSEVRSRTWDEEHHLWRLDVGGTEAPPGSPGPAAGPRSGADRVAPPGPPGPAAGPRSGADRVAPPGPPGPAAGPRSGADRVAPPGPPGPAAGPRSGADRVVTARHVISAIGPFVDPKPSGIEGVDDFEGKVIHSARWDHDYDLAGKRVAIVGTGASAVQIIPSIAGEVERLDVYQRTPIWVSPKPDPRIPDAVKKLFARVPFTQRVSRAVASAVTEAIIIRMPLNYERFPFVARLIERRNREFLRRQVRDPDLREKLTPTYGMGCKRPSVSNDYLRTFNRDNVELVVEPIDRATPTGVRCIDGTEREVDVVILATGFRLASDPENFRRTPVRGRDGFDLADHYERHRLKAYESISMPRLPNHFMIFGPYGWTGASWHVLVQTASTHITRVLGECRRRGATCVEVSQEATDRYHAEVVEKGMDGAVWFSGRCGAANSYYFDHHGDVPYVRPTTAGEAQRASRTFPLDDYRYETLVGGGPEAEREAVAA